MGQNGEKRSSKTRRHLTKYQQWISPGWGGIRSDKSELILLGSGFFISSSMNNVFVSTLLGKSVCEASMTDLLDVFEVLTDTEKLVDFEDTHGLIIGGVRCGL